MYDGNSAEIWILLTKVVPWPGYDLQSQAAFEPEFEFCLGLMNLNFRQNKNSLSAWLQIWITRRIRIQILSVPGYEFGFEAEYELSLSLVMNFRIPSKRLISKLILNLI